MNPLDLGDCTIPLIFRYSPVVISPLQFRKAPGSNLGATKITLFSEIRRLYISPDSRPESGNLQIETVETGRISGPSRNSWGNGGIPSGRAYVFARLKLAIWRLEAPIEAHKNPNFLEVFRAISSQFSTQWGYGHSRRPSPAKSHR